MLYENVKTGHIWDITDRKILKRIHKSPDYKPVEEPEEELPFVPEEKQKPKVAPKKAGVASGRTAAKAKK